MNQPEEVKQQFKRQEKWFDLMDLGRACPGEVNGVKIKGATRQLLWALISHAGGDSNATFVGRQTLLSELCCDRKTLDAATAALKQSRLVKTSQNFHADGRPGSNTWVVNRELLKVVVSSKVSEAALRDAIAAMREDGEASIEAPVRYAAQTKSCLIRLARELGVSIEIDTLEYEKTVALFIRTGLDILHADLPRTTAARA